MFIAKTLSFYKRLEVQRALVEHAQGKEVSVKFQTYFSKRPDALYNEGDVMEFAKKKASSFHSSEELWHDPLQIKTGMSASETKELRKGWDLILDIDCPDWELSKLITHLFIKALEEHGIGSVSSKFSVTGDTPVLCRIGTDTKLIPIKECIGLFKDGLPVEIFSLGNSYRPGFSKVIDSLEHKKEIFEIRHRHSTLPLRLSPDHSVYVFRDEGLKSIPTDQVTSKDYLVGFSDAIKNKPLSEVSASFTTRGKEHSSRVPLTQSMLRLIGYYVSEGHLVNKTYRYKGKNHKMNQIGFSFHIDEKEYQREVIDAILDLDASTPSNRSKTIEKPRVVDKPEVHTTQILFQSAKWCSFFHDHFGKGAKNKKVPPWFFKLSKEQFLAFFEAYINGDGHKGKDNYYLKSASEELIVGLSWLCSLHGIGCSVRSETISKRMMPQGVMMRASVSYMLTIPRSEIEIIEKKKCAPMTNSHLIPTSGLRKVYAQCKPKQFVKHRVLQSMLKKQMTNKEYIGRIIEWFKSTKSEEFDQRSERVINHYEKLVAADLTFHKVQSVRPLGVKRMVYDVTVKGSANFFGGRKPILLHNSGNKGFHIAVPFEAFPEHHGEAEVKDLFPEAPRKIAYYLLDFIKDHYITIEEDALTFTVGDQQKVRVNKKELAARLGKEQSELFKRVCETCGSDVREAKRRYSYLCPSCGFRKLEDERRDVLDCPKCGQFMKEDVIDESKLCECYEKYRRDDPRFNPVHVDRLNPLAVVEVDTILIAHRHLYRMPYSFHEKSQLISLPVRKESVLSLSKDKARWASPEHADFSVPFLDRSAARPGEAKGLLEEAYNHQLDESSLLSAEEEQEKKEYEIPQEAIPEDYFPPCLKAMLAGLKDGRKRALFTIINFLRGAGWSFEQIEETLLSWNERNEEPLRPVTIKGRLRYEKTKKQPLPPHNCKRYYQDFGVCKPDAFCDRIRNPLQYAKRKAEQAGVIGGKKGGRQKLTEEQKAMRRAYRERKKQAEKDS